MNYKVEILKLLDVLKKFGLDRRDVERELGYSERYLDQALSKGVNVKVYNRLLQLIDKCKLQFPTVKVTGPDEVLQYKLSKEANNPKETNGLSEDHSTLNDQIEDISKEFQEVAKGGEMTAMFLTLIEHLQNLASSLSETREIARENNSLVRTILLNQAKTLPSDQIDGAEKRFHASLEVARKMLRQTFSHT